MRFRQMTPLAAGFIAAAAITSFPASAADQSIAADSATATWMPNSATINAGDQITWSNDGGTHDVCVQKPGTSGSACSEFQNGPPSSSWTSVAHKFTEPGTYTFFCELHQSFGMTGTITVKASDTGTGTSTTPPPDSQPTDTITTPQTGTETLPAADTSAPAFTGKLKRRASKKSLILEFGSSEAGTLKATVTRRAPKAKSFKKVGEASLKAKHGHNVVTLPRKAAGSMRAGAYRVKLQLIDAAGNKSPTR